MRRKETKMNEVMQFVKKSDTTTELYIYGEIRKQEVWEILFDVESEHVSALSFKDALDQVDTPNLCVRINSMGGSVSEGLAIYNLLNSFGGNVTTIVDGFACSIASVIFMAGSKRIVPESALLMIHNAWSKAEGDAHTMRKAADDLEKITQPSINIYTSKTILTEAEIRNMMDQETWLEAKEAYEFGFATVLEKAEANQCLNDRYLAHLIKENKELRTKITNLGEQDDDFF